MDAHSSCEEKIEVLKAELEHYKKENGTLMFMLDVMRTKVSILQSDVEEAKWAKKQPVDDSSPRHEPCFGQVRDDGSQKKARVDQAPMSRPSQFVVRIDHNNKNDLTVKDGYQWRKYGQKVTKDNPSPRAYFRCSMAPCCPVKKKVQRSLGDSSRLVATYEGEHNHEPGESSVPMASSPLSRSSKDNVALDLTLSTCNGENKKRPFQKPVREDYSHFDNGQMRIEDYVASLTRDPNFTTALSSAVAKSITHIPMSRMM